MGFLDIFRKKKVDLILDGKLEQDWIVKEVISRVPGGCADFELTFSDSTGRVRRIEKWRCYMYSDTRVGAFPLYMEKMDYPNSNENPIIQSSTFGRENEKQTYSEVPIDVIEPSWTLSIDRNDIFYAKTYFDTLGRECRYEVWNLVKDDKKGFYALDLIHVNSKTYNCVVHTKEENLCGE